MKARIGLSKWLGAAIFAAGLVGGLAGLSGCASAPPEIIYSIAPDADFQSYRTLHLENVDTGDAPFYLTLDKALRSSLAKKGYVVTDKDADLTLLYKVTIDRGEKL